jgi:hypothetical protein
VQECKHPYRPPIYTKKGKGCWAFLKPVLGVRNRVDKKWRFQFFAKYDYRFLLDVIIAIIATFFA